MRGPPCWMLLTFLPPRPSSHLSQHPRAAARKSPSHSTAQLLARSPELSCQRASRTPETSQIQPPHCPPVIRTTHPSACAKTHSYRRRPAARTTSPPTRVTRSSCSATQHRYPEQAGLAIRRRQRCWPSRHSSPCSSLCA